MGKLQQLKMGKSGDQNTYHREFPKIFNNFEKRTLTVHKDNQNATTPKPNETTTPKVLPQNMQESFSEPPPYTLVQTLSARLRKIHAAQSPDKVLKTTPRQTTKQGQPAVIFDMHDFMHTLTLECMPKV